MEFVLVEFGSSSSEEEEKSDANDYDNFFRVATRTDYAWISKPLRDAAFWTVHVLDKVLF